MKERCASLLYAAKAGRVGGHTAHRPHGTGTVRGAVQGVG